MRPEFGPYDELTDIAHGWYIDGFADRAADVCVRWSVLTRAGGDVASTRYLGYIRATALHESGRHAEALGVARTLLDELGDDPAPVWRAKALAVVGECCAFLNDHAASLAALAEADRLVSTVPPGTYGHVSASMAVGLALRSINLFEQADERLRAIRGGAGPYVEVLVAQELALLSGYWAASLRLIGRDAEAAQHTSVMAQRALRMLRTATAVGDAQMAARAGVIEAHATMHLSDVALGAARAEAAAVGFAARPELVETQLLHLVRGWAAAERGDLDAAREQLVSAVENADRMGRETWAATARATLAEVARAQSGPHEGMDLWAAVGRSALARVWAEREARFHALQDRHRMHELAQETDRALRAVVHDPLTGLGNRRMLAASTQDGSLHEWAVFVDVDEFKAINDGWSHGVGDDVLRALADVLRSESRHSDVLVRYGGDEFLVLVQGGPDAALSVADRVQRAVGAYAWDALAPGLTVTVSIGVGGRSETRTHLQAADDALLEAKRSGRNRVSVA
ncbi:GGDEF domain-containing protein [Cellulomonas carbonis]|uniref:GGDEF domain-containing protein n=1 Tax=Cellulomonas carbonis T26 TaxID=947969 RepID=A0A0A0BPP1_9CELL|nr:GGDEF domain-containing protein [Cellulomonas carbonis]KGM10448.1 hypothetical protein N868_12765 [Cellulomonas carbonis T26]GGC13567.1 diguanylate cyclase [Cellulomonas carbonis]